MDSVALRVPCSRNAAPGGAMQTSSTSGELLRVEQVADRLGLKVSTIRAWLLARRISKVRVGRRSVRVPSTEVQRIIDEGLVPAKARDNR